jgi:glycine/D-amino acid oxidase-like deaminating enzyme
MTERRTTESWSRRVRRVPADDTDCGWIATLPPPPPPRRLAGGSAAGRADCVVVGAGFTGVAAARRLAALRPEWRVVLLDAQRAGFGAASRSSGFVVALAHFIARMEPAAARRTIRLSRWGIAELRELVGRHGIDCAWDESGWLHAAAGEPAERSLAMLARWLDGLEEGYERLDRAAMRELTGTDYYRAGIRLPGSVLVQPAALLRGLAAALPPSAELYEESPVRRLERQDGRYLIEAGDGALRADRLLLATNGALPALGFLRRRLFPLFTFGSLTRVLTPAEREALGGAPEWGLLAEDPLGSTVRRTRDQRLLIRNSVRYTRALGVSGRARERARAAHRRALRDRFPRLAAVPFDYTWGGLMGMSNNRQPFFGRLADGLFAAGGYNGCGIAMGTAAGRLLADLALGADSSELRDMLALPGPGWLPPEPFLGLGVRARLGLLAARARGRI